MTKQEIIAEIAAKIDGQGSAIDAGSALPGILRGIIDLIPAEQVNPDWNQTDNTKPDYIKNKPSIPEVVQTTGESTTAVMSQKAVSDNLASVNGILDEVLLDLAENKYLIFEAKTDGTIGWKTGGADWVKTIQYSRDFGRTWQDWTPTTDGANINVQTGDIIFIKGNNSTYYYFLSYPRYGCNFISTAEFYAYGNISALLGGNNMGDYCFKSLFEDCAKLYSHNVKKLKLPTTLADSCYSNMFYDCTSLTTAPELPAMTLADSCYSNMFNGCTSLVTAPELPATTLTNSCYQGMFYNCSSLKNVKCLATDISATNCVTSWLLGVASNGTFTKAASMTNWPSGVNGIPTGWTVQDAA